MPYKETLIPSPTAPPAPRMRSAIRRLPLSTSTSAAGFLTLAYAYLLAFELLQQLTATTHAPVALPYLFLAVIDGFIAFALFASVRLHRDEPAQSENAWMMAVLAIIVRAVTVIVFGHLGTRQSPGNVWQLDDLAVTVMSVGAPVILVFTVHLYALVAEHAAELDHRGDHGDAR